VLDDLEGNRDIGDRIGEAQCAHVAADGGQSLVAQSNALGRAEVVRNHAGVDGVADEVRVACITGGDIEE
jgi:hypothetical protein